MWSREIALNIFIVLAVTLCLTCTAATSCSDESCRADGMMLLKLNSSTKRVSWADSETIGDDDDVVASSELGERLALSETSSTSFMRLQALSRLEYDSNDGDNMPLEFELEFDDEQDDSFHQYVESTGYTEQSDATWAPEVWNSNPEVKASHNCYMYALNDLSPRSGGRCRQTQKLVQEGKLAISKKEVPKVCKRYFHKPGYYFQHFVSGHNETDPWFRSETTCRLMLPMIAADSPAITWKNDQNDTLKEDDSCPQNHYMAALFIQPQAGFHFYRRDHTCPNSPDKLCWSHKPGIEEATTKDASGNVIPSVLKADRNYGELNYSKHCAFFCVPQNSEARTHSDFKKKHKKHH